MSAPHAALLDALEQENEALTATDLPRAVAAARRKGPLLDALRAEPGAATEEQIQRLLQAASRNAALLQRAIMLQRDVIEIVADALHGAAAEPATSYAASSGSRPVVLARLV